ncbi:MAG TPA: hypothetical protein VFQ23_23470 [Anaerolineales bacterium]|nr:hypothetical protein [Anaerolineales bacterium]
MATNTLHEKDLHRVFHEIRQEIGNAQSREELTELYKRTGYMITMTHATPVEEKQDTEMKDRRETTEHEFATTVRLINSRAQELGVEADYNENWDGLAANGYEAEGENLLEAEENEQFDEGEVTTR